jgi:hypothetical protein
VFIIAQRANASCMASMRDVIWHVFLCAAFVCWNLSHVIVFFSVENEATPTRDLNVLDR